MNIDLTEKEVAMLRNAIDLLYNKARKDNVEILEIHNEQKEKRRKQLQRKPQPGCMCCLGFDEDKPKLHNLNPLMTLRTKLSQIAMLFPSKEHSKQRPFKD